ncbi:globin family protein [Loa loa]|uniref:Globin family protein n=1 Tax=Loa loa TaxID=7209 RepID=A0A1S0U934_LOALO|nr:globin family protein [Loa loa]EFO27096.1 globin family protein [Loa loa]
MSHLEMQAKCMKILNEAGRVGTDEEAIQHGKNFYKLFYVWPSSGFTGQKILLALRIVINTYNDPETFKAYAREMVNRHIRFKMDRTLWLAFFTVLVNSLKEHTRIDEETEKAFLQIGKEFSDECLKHTIALNLPN